MVATAHQPRGPPPQPPFALHDPGFRAAFATGIGFTTTWVAIFMTAMTVAGGVAQWPLGALSDLIPRRFALLLSTGAATAACIVAAGLVDAPPALMVASASAAAFGAAALPLYALANAVANDQVCQDERVAAGSTLFLLYGCGSIAGPLLASGAMEVLGSRGYFLCLAAICGALAVLTLVRIARNGLTGDPAPGTQPTPAE